MIRGAPILNEKKIIVQRKNILAFKKRMISYKLDTKRYIDRCVVNVSVIWKIDIMAGCVLAQALSRATTE